MFKIWFVKKISPLIYLLILGFLGALFYTQPLLLIVKDFTHVIKPILGISIGYLFFKVINDFRLFSKIIIYCGLASAIIHILILFFVADLFSGSISAIRYYTKDNFLELFSLVLLIYYKRFEGVRLLKSIFFHRITIIVLGFSAFMYFSRTMIVVAIIMLLTIYGFTALTRKSLRYVAVIITAILLFYAYLYSVKIERDGPGLQGFFYKVKMAPAELFTTKIDRNDHADLWDHWRGYETKRALALMDKNPPSIIFGNGLGSTVNLKFYAPLDDTPGSKGLRYISELHNGYIYVLYKFGVIGLAIYVILLLKWYHIINKRKDLIAILISAIALIYIFTTLTITGLYNSRDIFIFLLGALFHFNYIYDKKLLPKN
ncbi:MAG: O-antigen ligase family protein [Flavobacterium sp.]|nr:O-antigen ligase family protein [Flavobacterium sp.]